MKKLLCLLLAPCLAFASAISVAVLNPQNTPVKKEDFRVTTYLVSGGKKTADEMGLRADDFKIITDVIIFGTVTFDENGELTVDDTAISSAKEALAAVEAENGKKLRVFINLLGPDSQGEFDDWYVQMADKAQRHTKAFAAEGFAEKVAKLTQTYELDGIFFDYEYPIKKEYWKPFNSFLTELDALLGEKILGLAMADWDLGLSREALKAVDRIEIMLYDIFDENGNHASVDFCKKAANHMVKAGYDKAKIDYGVPFYARPSDKDAYWYDYSSYAGKIAADGSYFDQETNKTFWFNTPEMIAEKTSYALSEGFGGMMIWHYACDLPSTDEKSLLGAMGNQINA